MIGPARRVTGVVAIVTYMVMGGMVYFTVIPGADGHFPPDFHLLGYDATFLSPFLLALRDEARETYEQILAFWDPVFIVALAAWMALMGWRGGGLRYFVAAMAALYGAIDFAEDAALLAVIQADGVDGALIDIAHHWTMAKFASLYLCGLVLVVHIRRSA